MSHKAPRPVPEGMKRPDMSHRYVKKKLVISKGDGVYFTLTNEQLDRLEELIKEIKSEQV